MWFPQLRCWFTGTLTALIGFECRLKKSIFFLPVVLIFIPRPATCFCLFKINTQLQRLETTALLLGTMELHCLACVGDALQRFVRSR